MSSSLMRLLATFGLRTYALVLSAYPLAFRHEFGEPMALAFRDLTRDACRRSGIAGPMRLWVVTLSDTAAGLMRSYTSDPDRLSARALIGGATYVAVLVATIGYGALRFQQFYEPPAFSRFSEAASTNEDALIAAYTQALDGDFGQYRAYVTRANIVLALMLGVTAGLFGLAQRSPAYGAAVFALGVACTAGILSLMPTIWFPLDRYPVGFAWTMMAPLGVGVWLAAGAFGRLGSRRYRQPA